MQYIEKILIYLKYTITICRIEMRSLFNSKPSEGLAVVNPHNTKTRFFASKKFVFAELNDPENEEYVSVYLRPYDNNKTLITACLPELTYIETLKIFNKAGLLKLLTRSKIFADFYKSGSTIKRKPFLSRITDFTETQRNVDILCIQIMMDLPLTPKILDVRYSEYKTFEKM